MMGEKEEKYFCLLEELVAVWDLRCGRKRLKHV
jgi:hypothetical protein